MVTTVPTVTPGGPQRPPVPEPATLTRHLPLPRNRWLEVRPAGPDDRDGVMALYESLSVDDRRLRFFTGSRPSTTFVDGWLDLAARGGVCLVAVVHEADGRDELVAEAGWCPLPSGDGEFAITVAERWRGWLGPYLLDLLARSAAARGVPNLEGDVLVDNRRMRTLVRARGDAVFGRPDHNILRLAFGTDAPMPHFPPKAVRRLLVEAPAGRWRGEAEARQAGWCVVGCGGPDPATHRCPLLEGGVCPLAAEADAVVVAGSAPRARALVDAHRRARPDLVVCVDPPLPALDDSDLGSRTSVADALLHMGRTVEARRRARSQTGGATASEVTVTASPSCSRTASTAAATSSEVASMVSSSTNASG